MKRPKKLTYELKQAVSVYDLNPKEWMLAKDGDIYVTIINREGKTRIIDKHARKPKQKRG